MLEFTVKAGKTMVRIESPDQESTLLKCLMDRRRAVLGMRDNTRASVLFSEPPKKAVVSGDGSSKTYRVRWEKAGKTKFPGSRHGFSIEESALRSILGRLKVGA